jgi:cytochrome b subunit of formate dehydrogenase
MWYGYLADLLVFVHVLYVGYVVVGQLAIMVAAPFRWEWARNPWFRFSHLLAIGIVAYEALNDIRCPLTVWEEQLRALGGQDVNAGQSFMGRLFHGVLFYPDLPEIFFNTLHVAMFVLVVQGLVMYPPRLWRRHSSVAAPNPPVGSTLASIA